MYKWIIVNFFNDNSIEAVPDIWLKQNVCAWPIDKKDFTFFSARKLGNKVYGKYLYIFNYI